VRACVQHCAAKKATCDLVADAPIVSCESSWAHVGDRNVFVRCKVKARPKVTAVFWILDGNGTTVTEGQVVNEHWTLVMVGVVACNRHYGVATFAVASDVSLSLYLVINSVSAAVIVYAYYNPLSNSIAKVVLLLVSVSGCVFVNAINLEPFEVSS